MIPVAPEGRCPQPADFRLYDVIEHVPALAAAAAQGSDHPS
jgi:hypothetical protein